MEKNFINWPGPTGFYVNLEGVTYGVLVNIKESEIAEKIIAQVLEENKECIEAWKREWKEGVI